MAIDLTQFRNKVLPHVPGCPFFKVDEAVRDAAIEFCEDTHLFKRGFWVADATASTPSGNFPFTLPVAFGSSGAGFGIITIDLTSYYTGYDPIVVTAFKMDGADYGLYNMALPTNHQDMDSFGTEGRQYKLFGFLSNTSLVLYPFDTSEVHDFFIQLAVKPQKTVTSLDDLIYQDWQRAITYLAISKLQEIPGEKWSSDALSDRNMGKYRGEMGRAKLRVNKGFVKGDHQIKGGYF